MKKIIVTLEYELKSVNINDLISTALEGGINYWCGKAVIKKENDIIVGVDENTKYEFASDIISLGGTLILHDVESSDKWELNLDNVLKGIQMHCTKKNITPIELMDDYDADDADSIVQYALFDELVFG